MPIDADCVFMEELIGAPLSLQAFAALRIAKKSTRPILWIVGGQRDLETISADLESLAGDDLPIMPFHPSEPPDAEGNSPVGDDGNGRLDALVGLLDTDSPAIVPTCVHALLQPTISPEDLARSSLKLEVGTQCDPEQLAENFADQGYRFVPEVQGRGEAALRGGILDLWCPTSDWPVRLEFFGSELESIRVFDPVDQASIERLRDIVLQPPSSRPLDGCSSILDYLPRDTVVCWIDLADLDEHARIAEQSDAAHSLLGWSDTKTEIGKRFLSPAVSAETSAMGFDAVPRDLKPVETLAMPAEGVLDHDLLGRRRLDYLKRLAALAGAGFKVDIYFHTEGAKERFAELYGGIVDFGRFNIHQSYLSHGFCSDNLKLAVIAESDLCGYSRDFRPQRRRRLRRRDRRRDIERIQTWTQLQPGDLVVHVDNGVGRYLGLYEIQAGAGTREVLAIEYAGESKLYVPPDHAHLLSRYIGIGRQAPKLHKLGGSRWERDKRSAERAVEDLAASMLETQAARATKRGFACRKDGMMQREFENSFPYEETPDQERAIAEVKKDMESRRPMDRLICGDVGYGKTEVAMRAAFKAVVSGRQVAVLVPTTILAQQHFETFRERMEAFPVSIEMLSRFRSHGQQAGTVERMRNGELDIVVGTHRLVQTDVRFKNLGLVIIDEEQRFGVRQKERLKSLRRMVDVLTMTATPIPRTLYMSLAGAKDMSTIQTAPRERVAVETIVEPFSEDLVRTAILREMERDGQVYMLHNRVKSIENLHGRLVELVPEARIQIAHGQMPECQLADVMHRFGAGDIDVLLCTTIIESGVDIPNVNTILVDRADRFGLADLYQLRGRVGRYNRKAYAYLLLPRDGGLFDTARRRIRAIQRYSGLGAGFNLALRDLEIRGAGNLLGREQSGHIAAIGFDLYCQLLERTIARLKGKQPREVIDVEIRIDFIDRSPRKVSSPQAAMLPYDYIEDEDLRLKFYRDLARCSDHKEINRFRRRIADQFGRLPKAVELLIEIARIRLLAGSKRIHRVEVRDSRVMLSRGNGYIMKSNRFPRLQSQTVSERLNELRKLIDRQQ